MTSDNNQEAVKPVRAWAIYSDDGKTLYGVNWTPNSIDPESTAKWVDVMITPIESKEPVSLVAEEKPLLDFYCPICKRKLESYYDFEKGHEVYFCNDSCESGYRGHFGSDLKKIRQPSPDPIIDNLNAKIKADAVDYINLMCKNQGLEREIARLKEENGNLKEIIENKKYIIKLMVNSEPNETKTTL